MIVFKGALLIFRRNLNNPTENDIKVKFAFLIALKYIWISIAVLLTWGGATASLIAIKQL